MTPTAQTAGDPEVACHHVLEALAPHLHGLDPLDRAVLLDTVAEALRGRAASQVRKSRAAGLTWARIGLRFGVSRQAAQQRWG